MACASSDGSSEPILTESEEQKLKAQESRGFLSTFRQNKLEMEAGQNWDKFYKRNENRFFKDRHWTTREFIELLGNVDDQRTLFEIGCGVGNFFYPLLAENLNFFIHACDFSKRAIDIVKENPRYDHSKINAFVCDITKDEFEVPTNAVDLTSLIFVLSAILPSHYNYVMQNVIKVLRPGGLLLFRDYGINDMAMIRFGPGCKLEDKLYVRQDGTRAYYFTVEELNDVFTKAGLEIISNEYVIRRTVNKKEGVDAKRVFIQAKCRKPSDK